MEGGWQLGLCGWHVMWGCGQLPAISSFNMLFLFPHCDHCHHHPSWTEHSEYHVLACVWYLLTSSQWYLFQWLHVVRYHITSFSLYCLLKLCTFQRYICAHFAETLPNSTMCHSSCHLVHFSHTFIHSCASVPQLGSFQNPDFVLGCSLLWTSCLQSLFNPWSHCTFNFCPFMQSQALPLFLQWLCLPFHMALPPLLKLGRKHPGDELICETLHDKLLSHSF